MIRVLVVDDNADNRRALARVLAGNGFDVATASDAGRALLLADLAPPDVVLVGYQLDSGCPHLVRALRERRSGDMFVAVLHDGFGPVIEAECRRAGADLVMGTPHGEDLCRMISVAATRAAA
jgi:CheY-like chemotaxis protein